MKTDIFRKKAKNKENVFMPEKIESRCVQNEDSSIFFIRFTEKKGLAPTVVALDPEMASKLVLAISESPMGVFIRTAEEKEKDVMFR